MRVIHSAMWTVVFAVAIFLLAPASVWAARPIQLNGIWRFAMDPSDSGERQQWFNLNLPYSIRLPGILQSQNHGDEISTKTPWVLSLYEPEPVVWAIDDWNRNYKLGVIFEGAVGDGRLLVSAFDVTTPADSNPVARQLRNSLLKYMMSDCFQPQVSVSPEQMRSLFFDTRIMKKLGAVAQVGGASANTAIDGDPNTFLLVGDQRGQTREQVDIVINFPAPVAMSGLVLMPRQNHREHEGDIREYVVQASDDGSDWREVVRGQLLSTFVPQEIEFSKTITGRYLKLISLSGFGADKTTALAELAVMYAGPKLNDSAGTIEYRRNRSATPDIDEGTGADKQPKPKASPARPKP